MSSVQRARRNVELSLLPRNATKRIPKALLIETVPLFGIGRPFASKQRAPHAGKGNLTFARLGLARHKSSTSHHSGGAPSPLYLKSATQRASGYAAGDDHVLGTRIGRGKIPIDEAEIFVKAGAGDGSGAGSNKLRVAGSDFCGTGASTAAAHMFFWRTVHDHRSHLPQNLTSLKAWSAASPVDCRWSAWACAFP
jgi:hypothetical protein